MKQTLPIGFCFVSWLVLCSCFSYHVLQSSTTPKASDFQAPREYMLQEVRGYDQPVLVKARFVEHDSVLHVSEVSHEQMSKDKIALGKITSVPD
jgi:hypothetical protein